MRRSRRVVGLEDLPPHVQALIYVLGGIGTAVFGVLTVVGRKVMQETDRAAGPSSAAVIKAAIDDIADDVERMREQLRRIEDCQREHTRTLQSIDKSVSVLVERGMRQ